MTPEDPVNPPPELDAAVDAIFAYGRHNRAPERPKYSHPTLTPTGKKRKRKKNPPRTRREST